MLASQNGHVRVVDRLIQHIHLPAIPLLPGLSRKNIQYPGIPVYKRKENPAFCPSISSLRSRARQATLIGMVH